MSDTYYSYRDVKVMMAHKLMTMEGWKVYGYYADNSDIMTDYYDPAHWGGIAEKNGYVLVVGHTSKGKAEEIRKYNNEYSYGLDADTREKIQKLEAITTERGASEAEEKTAKEKIALFKNKAVEKKGNKPAYEVIGMIPAHEANPPRCNWHIEREGVIVAKGSGILKYAEVDSYFNYSHYKEDYEAFKNDKQKWIEKEKRRETMDGYHRTEADLLKQVQYRIDNMEEVSKKIEEFNQFIHKIDTTCGGILGEGEQVTYERIKVTEYKTENKAVECSGSLKEGQHFVVKSSGFNYGVSKGYVYVIHEHEGTKGNYYTANRLDGKLRKELTGKANVANSWGHITEGRSMDNFKKWIETGSLAYCRIEEVKTPYEVEKVVKKVVSPEPTTEEKKETKEKIQVKPHNYEILEDVDTRNNGKIFVVKIIDKLDRDEYLEVNSQMQQIGGYYSRFKHGFLFKDDPTEILTV